MTFLSHGKLEKYLRKTENCGNQKAVLKSCGKHPKENEKWQKAGKQEKKLRKAGKNIKFSTESRKRTPYNPPINRAHQELQVRS